MMMGVVVYLCEPEEGHGNARKTNSTFQRDHNHSIEH